MVPSLVLLALMASVSARASELKPTTPPQPPPELYPPPAPDVPYVVAAGAYTLVCELVIPCSRVCPDTVSWFYKKLPDDAVKQQTSTTTLQANHAKATVRIVNLEQNSTYQLLAKPVTTDGSKKLHWYTKSPKAPNTESITAETCSKIVQPVQDLLVHTTGPRWLALSWSPPAPSCITRLEYHVRYYAALMPDGNSTPYEKVGSFCTNATWAVQGRVTPCLAWPGRHCLLLMDNIVPQKKYVVEVHVKQIVDDNALSSSKQSLLATATDLAPGAPPDLICVRADLTTLHLLWRCPLVPGGQLAHANILVRSAAGAVVQNLTKNVSLCAEYTHRVVSLTANTLYNVSVNFVTTAGKEGPWRSLPVRTSSSHETTERTTDWTTQWTTSWPCGMLPLEPDVMRVTGDDGSGNITALPWWWLVAIALPLLLLVFVAFFVGRRCRTQAQWKRQRLHDQQSTDGVGGESVRKAAVFGGCEGKTRQGDKAALCLTPGEQPLVTPPASLFEYAEVDLSSGRAWAACRGSKAPSFASTGHYENVEGSPSYTEQSFTTPSQSPVTNYYAEVGDPTLTQGAPPSPSPSLYAEVEHSTALQASSPATHSYAEVNPPLPEPSQRPPEDASVPAAVPQYAQVNKKRPPRPPPALPPQYAQVKKKRPPLQPSGHSGD